jgi:membrane-associated protein
VPGGELKLWGVLAAAIAGALLGDGSAFWPAIARNARSQRVADVEYPGVMAQSEAFFHRWGRWLSFSRALCRRSVPSCR